MGMNRGWWVALALVLALGAGLVFDRHRVPVVPGPGAPAGAVVSLSASQVERSIERTLEAVKAEPADAAGWAMLAHSYVMLGRYGAASEAYAKLLALRPDDAAVHADAADALAAAQGGRLQGAPAALVARALLLDPASLRALGLAAKEAFERRRYDEAAAYWERALKLTQDAGVRQQIELSLAEARALGAPAPAATVATVAATTSAASGLAFVSGRVTVAAALQDRIAPDDTVFVFARPAEGSRMPVALLRRQARDLPLYFALDDTLAMVPQSRLSQQGRVMLGVRVSRRGDAIAAPGDLQGQLGPVALGTTGLRLEITDVVK
jgi:cytochrome c-type biogenesis protein CcmH